MAAISKFHLELYLTRELLAAWVTCIYFGSNHTRPLQHKSQNDMTDQHVTYISKKEHIYQRHELNGTSSFCVHKSCHFDLLSIKLSSLELQKFW